MAEYSKVIKQFKRMCRYYNGVKEGCPLYCKGHGCNISHCRMLAFDDKKFQNVIMAWAAEHPEPVYPTWYEWLYSLSLAKFDSSDEAWALGEKYRETSKDVPGVWVLTNFAKAHIPADIAQKLGIEPKEG